MRLVCGFLEKPCRPREKNNSPGRTSCSRIDFSGAQETLFNPYMLCHFARLGNQRYVKRPVYGTFFSFFFFSLPRQVIANSVISFLIVVVSVTVRSKQLVDYIKLD